MKLATSFSAVDLQGSTEEEARNRATAPFSRIPCFFF